MTTGMWAVAIVVAIGVSAVAVGKFLAWRSEQLEAMREDEADDDRT